MGLLADIADAVVALLNEGDFSMEFTAERNYSPLFSLSELADIQVVVVPKGLQISPVSRGQIQKTVQVDIGVMKKLTDSDEMDDLLALVEEIVDYMTRLNLDTPAATWSETANEPVYAQEHLAQFRQFTSVITLTYQVSA